MTGEAMQNDPRVRRLGPAVAITSILAVAIAVSTPAPAAGQAETAALRRVEARRPLAPTGLIRVWNLAGSVHVLGWDRDSVAVTGTVPASENFFCGGTPSGVKCGIDVPPGDAGPSAGADLEVRVPRRSQLWIKSGTASIEVSGFAGDLEAYSVSGAIHVEGALHVLSAESMGGDIDVSGSATTLRVRTASGAVRLTCAAEDASATSVSGGLELAGGRFRRGHFESVDGDIRWHGVPPAGASLDFLSHGGSIELHLPRGTAGDFVVRSYEGRILNELSDARATAARDLAGRELRFTLEPYNGARISVQSFKGPVSLLRR